MVKVPAQTADSGASKRERSGFLDGLRPALKPAALKPVGAVIPPETGAQVTDGVIDQGARPTDALFLRFLSRHRSALKKTARSYFQGTKPFPLSERQRWKGRQRRIGLTGGIASGKSSVGEYLTTLGLPVLDADVYSRRALAHGSKAAEAVLKRYGSRVSQPFDSIDHETSASPTINRTALGQIVFNDPKERLWLEQLVHPIVLHSFEKEIALQPQTTALVLMIPLLFEASLQAMCSEIWVVHCDPAQQLERLCQRDGLEEATALARIRSQWPLSEKCQRADLVLDNSRDQEAWKRQITSHLD